MNINLSQAKAQLSSLVKRVEKGEEIVLCKAGRPVAKLVQYGSVRVHLPRTPGGLEGQIWIADDFDELPEEVAAAFRGEAD
jgi:prevent-host-death family protein